MIEGADARLIGSPGLGRDELAALQRSTIAVIGVGALGGALSTHLGMLGVRLWLVDVGRVEPENLGNQAFRSSDLGEWKVVARARQIAAINPHCDVRTLSCRIEDVGLALIRGVDAIVSAVDGRAARVRIDEIATRNGIPWVDGAVDGSGRWLHGTVTAFDPRQAISPCYLCRWDKRDLEAIRREGRGNGCPNPLRPQLPATSPTLQASPFGAIVAGFQTLFALRILLGRGDPPGSQLIVQSDGAPRLRTVDLRRNPHCLSDHEDLGALSVVQGNSLGDLMREAETALSRRPEELSMARPLVEGLVCTACGATRDVVRAVATFGDAAAHCSCGADAELAPMKVTDRIPWQAAERLASRTWEDLGIPAAEVAGARAGSSEARFIVNAHAPFSAWQPCCDATGWRASS